MKGLIEVAGPREIQQAPETAILGVLEHALIVASTSLMVEQPAVGRVSQCYEGRVPPRDVLLAQLIVDRCAELGELIVYYRRGCPQVRTNHLDPDDDGDELLF